MGNVVRVGSILSNVSSDTRALARTFDSEINIANKRAEVLDVSVFAGETPASDMEITAKLVALQSVFQLKPEFWSTLTLVIKESGISKNRLQYCVVEFLKKHTYNNSFTPAELLSIDKTITVSRTIKGLRDKIKYHLEYEDIVMVEFNQERRYVLKDDAKVYQMNILATLNEFGIPQFIGTYVNQDFEVRQKAFAECVKRFLDRYPRQLLLDFYYYWSAPMQCGDVMRKELFWNVRHDEYGKEIDDTESYIIDWAAKHKDKYSN